MQLQFLPRAIIMVIRKVIARLSAPSRRQPRRLFSKTYCIFPGLAKFGIAPGLGPGDRGFKSRSPDQNWTDNRYNVSVVGPVSLCLKSLEIRRFFMQSRVHRLSRPSDKAAVFCRKGPISAFWHKSYRFTTGYRFIKKSACVEPSRAPSQALALFRFTAFR